jgi:hypothetical protein
MMSSVDDFEHSSFRVGGGRPIVGGEMAVAPSEPRAVGGAQGWSKRRKEVRRLQQDSRARGAGGRRKTS